MKNRSLFTKSGRHPMVGRFVCALLIAITSLTLASCHSAAYYYYKFPEYTFANRPIPPSRIANRVMIGVSVNGGQGALVIVDALRDIRSNVQNTIKSFAITGYSSGFPNHIFNFPEEVRAYVYSDSDGSLTNINYSSESSTGSVATFAANSTSVSVPQSFTVFVGGVQSAGQLVVIDNATGRSYSLNLPNVYQVAVNDGGTVALAMVRHSNSLYRIVKLNQNSLAAPGSIDCQPVILPVYCVVPVPDNPTTPGFDNPISAYFSLDGTTAYILNCGPECGGKVASISTIPQLALNINTVPTSAPYPSPVTANILVPGGATTALSDGSNLYIAGQRLQSDGLFAGFLSIMSLANNSVAPPISISDGTHTKLLFADDNTLWIGSEYCATGERAHQASLGVTTQAANYNCLTRLDLGTRAASIVPAVTPGSTTAVVPFPNTNGDQYYYGSLTGLCWVQNLHKVYTAYGGQVHAFRTADGSEIDNSLIAVQGTALDVAYMDAVTDDAN